jgi:hypothetical protein
MGRCPLTVCRPTVSGLFHSPSGVLFTFPSRYWCAIGRRGYLALGGGPPGFPRDFPCPVVLGVGGGRGWSFAYGAITLFGGPFQGPSARPSLCDSLGELPLPLPLPATPRPQRRQPFGRSWFGLFPFRSPLLGEWISFPRGTEMFQFPRFPPLGSWPLRCPEINPGGLPHWGIPGSKPASGSPGLIAAWPRPSSALGAQASAVGP